MHYRLKSDHGNKLNFVRTLRSKPGQSWVRVSFNDQCHGLQAFDVPEAFLEESGWEPEPEPEPIEELLEKLATSPVTADCWADIDRPAVMLRAAAEIRALRAERETVTAELEARVRKLEENS